MGNFLEILIFLFLLALGYFAGRYFERKHYKSIRLRESKTLHIPLITFGAKQPLPDAKEAKLFIGCVVISTDYFKTISAGLRNLVGGRVMAYETLLDRGRREALLRMKEQAIEWGATQILNVRLETASIWGAEGKQSVGSVEVIAYGTGIKE